MWSTERLIFDDKALAVREVCKVDNFSLQVNAPTRISRQLEQAIGSVQVTMKLQFDNNLKTYASSRSTLRRWWSSQTEKKKIGLGAGVKEFTENVLAKLGAELLKPT